MKYLAQMELKKLKILNIGSNYISDDGLKYLSSSNFLENIEELDISNNEISSKGILFIVVVEKSMSS